MCWISLPPSTTCSSCWPPQMPSTGLSCAERAAGDAELEGGAAVLGDDGRVPRAAAVVGRIDVEGAAGHDQRVDALEIVGRRGRARAAAPPAGRRPRRWRRGSSGAAHTRETWSSRRAFQHPGSRRSGDGTCAQDIMPSRAKRRMQAPLRRRGDVPRHVLERLVGVDAVLLGHLQHALGDDVALDLVGAAGDRGRRAPRPGSRR